MRRIISLLAALSLSLMLTACGSSPAVAPKASDNMEADIPEASVTPVEAVPEVREYGPEHIASLMARSPVEIALNGSSTKVESWEDFEEYNKVIKAMGFKEFHAGYGAPTEEIIIEQGLQAMYEAMGPEFKLEELKHNGEVFRLDFDYTDFDTEKYELYGTEGKLVDGWIILGTKADSPANISGFSPKDFDYSDSLDHREFFPEFYDGYCHIVEYHFYNVDENDLPSVFVQCTAMYYPESGNLYNIINVFYENLLEFTTASPQLTYHNREAEENWG